jgi:type I restriction enzyme S subunit
MIKFSEAISRSGLFSDGDWVESKDQDPEGDVRLIQLADIGVGEFIDKSNRFMTSKRADELRCSYLKAGDILVARMPDPIGRACIFPEDMGRCVTVVDICIVRPDSERIDNRWLMHLINSERFRNQIDRHVTGTTRQRISRGNLAGLEIPLPPLPEQKRIAAILDKADAIRRKRQQAIQLADDFLRAVFLDMFGDVIEGAENVVRFSDVAVLDAPMVDPRVDEYIDLIHIGPDRIEKKIGKLLPALTAREEGLISKKFLFDDRYVLYSKIRPYLRKCAMAEGVGLCSADMYPVRPVEGVATKEFLWMLLLSDFFTAYTESLPARANIPKLNREELEAFTLSLPDYSRQLKFSSIVRATNIAGQRVVESAAYVDGAFVSLSQKAFSGQL